MKINPNTGVLSTHTSHQVRLNWCESFQPVLMLPYAGRLQIGQKRGVNEGLLHLRWVWVWWAFGVWNNTRRSCVLVMQGPTCICPSLSRSQSRHRGLGSKSRLSILLALFGYGEWWHWKLATTPHCTSKVGITCVRCFSAPETCSRSRAVGEPGSRKRRGISRTFCSSVSPILRFCKSVSVSDSKLVAGLWVLVSYSGVSTARSHCLLHHPQAAVLCETVWLWQLQAIGLVVQKISLTLELITDNSVHFLILATIYVQSQGRSQLMTKLRLHFPKMQQRESKEMLRRRLEMG